MASFQGSTTTQILAPPPVLRDLRVFAAAIITACSSLPIPARPLPLPLTAVVYTSDAAGARFARVRGRRIPNGGVGNGAASVRLNEHGTVVFCARITWPASFLLHVSDSAGRSFG